MYGTRSRSQAATLHKVAMLVRVEVLSNDIQYTPGDVGLEFTEPEHLEPAPQDHRRLQRRL